MKQSVVMLDFTWRAIFKVFIVSILFFILYLIRSVLVWIVLGLIISTLLNPWINSLEKRKIKRFLAAIIVYFSLVILLGLFVFIIIPPLVSEVQFFSINIVKYFSDIPSILSQLGFNSLQDIASISTSLQNHLISISGNVFNFISSLFGSIFAGITVFVLALFMSIEEKEILKAIRAVSPKQFEEEVINRWQRSQDQVVAWFGSRVLCCFAVALMTFFLCVFLKIKFALSLSLLAGILNFIPVIGPIIATVILVIFAAIDSWVKVLLVVIFSIIIQQIESNILTPIFTKKMVGLPNVLVLLSLLIGGILGGIIGAILAIPLAGIFFESAKDYFKRRKLRED